jgi:hypothetical protein
MSGEGGGIVKSFVHAKGGGDLSRVEDLKSTMDAAEGALVEGEGPFELRKNDEELGERLERKDALHNLRAELEHGSVGDVYRVRDAKEVVFRAREAVPAREVVDTSGNAKIDAVWGFIKGKHADCNFLGAFVCKHVIGTSTPSQHSYGNAVDAGAGTMGELRKLADQLVDEAKTLSVAHVIVADKIWNQDVGWHDYTGEFHHHVHVDCDPNLSGPCGVKG